MRTRNVEIILYNQEDVLKRLDILGDNYEYAYIRHDKDSDEDNKPIKPHYHLRIFCSNQKSISAWATILQVKENDVQKLDDKKRAIRYLIHLDSPKKYQYNQEDIIHNILDIDKYFEDGKLEEGQQLKYIFAYIDNMQGYIYYYQVKNFVLQNNYWSSYRRYYQVIKDVIIEHNRYCIDYMLN